MNEIERQILENQKVTFSMLTAIYTKDGDHPKNSSIVSSMDKCYWDTVNLLDPKTEYIEACDMSDLDEMDEEEDAHKDAFGGDREK